MRMGRRLQHGRITFLYVKAHFYHNGNGRSARCLIIFCFLRMNLKPIVFDDSSRNEYNNALEDEDHIQFAAFIDKIWKAKSRLQGGHGMKMRNDEKKE
ncbi:hypothetical protein niasHT_006119 [Heterodera trifolii]|uniref:Fido domain-containing protein n=1 Tax=Heterodera trifolii TaxID=157864 RepID=A0ABD2M6D8_9BILA